MNERLVNSVVRRVLAEMGGAGNSPAGKAGGAARVWLTVEMLADRAGGEGVVALAAGEHLTPAAADYAAASGIEVARQPVHTPVTPMAPGTIKPAALTRTLGLVANRPDAKCEAALSAATRGGVVTRGFGDSSCWMANTRAMCGAINAGALAGGIIIDRYAAAAMVLAGKIEGIRPVQGVSAQAVQAALRQFNANVLVIGCVGHSVYEIRSMIERFAAGRRMGRERTVLLDAVDQLESEGLACESPE